MKQLLRIFLFSAVLCAALAVTSMAVYVGPPTGTQYSVPDGTLYVNLQAGSIVTCRGTMTEVEIPAYIDGVMITHIENSDWNWNCPNLKKIVIPDTVTKLSLLAFQYCKSLESVTIPASVTDLTYEGGLIGWKDSLKEVHVDSGNKNFSSLDGVLFDRNQKKILYVPRGRTGEYAIPDSVTQIEEYAFYHTGVTKVTIPNGVKTIEDYTFRESSLQSIVIPGNVTTIKYGAFEDCKNLENVTISDGVTTIWRSAFYGCDNLTSVTIPASVRKLAEADADIRNDEQITTFHFCQKLTAIHVDEGNPVYSSVDGVLFDKEQKTILAFPTGRKGSYTIPDGVTRMGEWVFFSADELTEVIFPSSMTQIGERAFYGCDRLDSVVIADGVTAIGNNAFSRCKNLTRLVIPASVVRVGRYSFEGDTFESPTRETHLYYGGSEAQWNAIEGLNPDMMKHTILHFNSASLSPSGSESPAQTFTDVPEGSYYAEAVRWAVAQGITNGTTAVTFSPYEPCTTAQILTFLWRANESPEPSVMNPFTDIVSENYYYKAALWAYEKGLADGMAFGAEKPCTRAAVMTYLWKLAGRPITGGSLFSDVSADASYARAVTWAVECGITNGTSVTTFSPDNICTRGQIVTFLWRYYET